MKIRAELRDLKNITYYEGENFCELELLEDRINFTERHESDVPKDWDEPMITEYQKCDLSFVVKRADVSGVQRAYSNKYEKYFVAIEIKGCNYDISVWLNSAKEAEQKFKQITEWWFEK